MTWIFNPRPAMVMTHRHARDQSRRLNSSKDEWNQIDETDMTDFITFLANQLIYHKFSEQSK